MEMHLNALQNIRYLIRALICQGKRLRKLFDNSSGSIRFRKVFTVQFMMKGAC